MKIFHTSIFAALAFLIPSLTHSAECAPELLRALNLYNEVADSSTRGEAKKKTTRLDDLALKNPECKNVLLLANKSREQLGLPQLVLFPKEVNYSCDGCTVTKTITPSPIRTRGATRPEAIEQR